MFDYSQLMDTKYLIRLLIIGLVSVVIGYAAKFAIDKLEEIDMFDRFKGKWSVEKILFITAIVATIVIEATAIDKLLSQ